jgi:hypothetical protein
MLLIGAALRWFWFWYLKNVDSITVQLLYAATVPFTVILLRGTFPDTFTRMLFAVVPLLIVQRIVSRGRHSVRRVLASTIMPNSEQAALRSSKIF